jgi:hypothetical protein
MTTTSPLAESALLPRPVLAPLPAPALIDEPKPDVLERVAGAMRSHGIEAIVVETAADARAAVLSIVPEGAEVHSGKSKTIEDLGLFAELMESGRYDARMGVDTMLAKVLITYGEWIHDRTTVILVREPIGI